MQKTAIPGLVKEKEGVILNVDNTSLKNYKAKKEKDRRINTLEETVTNMQNDLNDIKTLLQRLVK
jgi:hypothetical protein